MEKKKILITGASGFIGSYLMENFNNKEYQLIPLVRKLPDYFKYWRKYHNLIECDIMDLEQLKKKIPKIDYIIHLAAYNDVLTKTFPEKALYINGIGTRNLLTIAIEKKCELFIYFSTLQVYGKELEGIINVKSPINLHNDYALTHYIAEEYCRMFSLNHKIKLNIFRPSNIFGSLLNKNINRWSLVPLCFCKEAFEKNKIIIKSSGKQMRDFIDLDSILKSVKFVLKNNSNGFNIYNISSESTFSISEIAQMTKDVAQRELIKEIELKYESKIPIKSNRFLVQNNLLKPMGKEMIKKKMHLEITKIFKLLNN